MAILTISNICKSYGIDSILENVSFGVEDKDRIGLVGSNGCGKTTLFKIITGEEDADSGDVFVRKSCRISHLKQQTSSTSLLSVYNEVLSAFPRLTELEEKLAEFENMENLTESDVALQTRLHDEYVAGGGLVYKSHISSALKGLGFTEKEFSLSVSKLSGGQITRLLLCKTLLSGADLILLDEPTNHLDIASCQWLEKFLNEYNGAYIVISHDRYFLDRVTEKTVEISHSRATLYNGNYTVFQKLKAERELTISRRYENTMQEVRRIEGIIEQQKQWNRERNIRTAESKQKMIARMMEGLEAPESAEGKIKFRFAVRRNAPNDILIAKGISKSFGGKEIFSNASVHIRKGDRSFILGDNGCGKTTLFKIFMKQLFPDRGEFTFGPGVEIGYYDQMQSNIDNNKDVFSEIYDSYPHMLESEVRRALAAFLFRGDDVFKQIKTLSGGERARVLLCKLMLSGANFLILDEPTNHLDIASCEALESALEGYEGTLLIVSHDRYFINKMARRIYSLKSDGTVFYDGNYDYYLEKTSVSTEQKIKEAPKRVVNDYKLEKERRSALNRLKGQLSRCEDLISEIEEKIEGINNQLTDPSVTSDYEKTIELSKELDALNLELEENMELWQELSIQIEEF